MGTSHKLVLDDAWEFDFSLVAIHCSLEDYRMVYQLNRSLDMQLTRSRIDLDLKAKEVYARFPLYHYWDEVHYLNYHLVSNSCRAIAQEIMSTDGLFAGREIQGKSYHLLPELPKADYLLRIKSESYAFAKAKLLASINKIPQVITAYEVIVDQLKEKNNLIFE
ncbi:IPExxxVDY family protein [Croceiramulus getboli]|nr:IPExxxVDY family protein [Flavobacteriaceae bacterium YJPT1-3]